VKIAIDSQATRVHSGLGTYSRCLTDAILKTNREKHEISLISRDKKGDLNTLERLIWENWELPNKVKRLKPDILHVPAFALPKRKPCKTVVTVPDLIGVTFPNQVGWPSRFYWGKWLPSTLKKADFIITISEATKRDVIKILGFPEDKIRVSYPSGHEGFLRKTDSKTFTPLKTQLGIREKYFLFVGTIEPRKNLARVIQAFNLFKKRFKGDVQYQLAIVGSKEFGHGQVYQNLIKEGSLNQEDVIFTGYVSHDELNSLYSFSEALVFPSLYEGFGIPILEAFASGTAVLTSTSSSLPEVAGEAAILVDPRDTEAIAHGLWEIATESELRSGLIERGFNRLKQFSWEKAAKEALDVYESI